MFDVLEYKATFGSDEDKRKLKNCHYLVSQIENKLKHNKDYIFEFKKHNDLYIVRKTENKYILKLKTLEFTKIYEYKELKYITALIIEHRAYPERHYVKKNLKEELKKRFNEFIRISECINGARARMELYNKR